MDLIIFKNKKTGEFIGYRGYPADDKTPQKSYEMNFRGASWTDIEYLIIADLTKIEETIKAGKVDFAYNVQGIPNDVVIHPPIHLSITGLLQLTVFNGGLMQRYVLDLPLADRQVNLVADPIYDKLIEIAIIKEMATGALDIWHQENEGTMPPNYELIQNLLKFTLPAGTTNLNTLGIL